jgi:hypothetical protein
MNIEKKLEIFEKYDFSKSALLKRAGLNYESHKSNLYHGIANKIQILVINIGIIASVELEDIEKYKKVEDKVFKNYGCLQTKYQTIDWDELDQNDSDCVVLFKMKKMIDQLGRDIDRFLRKTRLEFKVNLLESREYKELKKKIEGSSELMQQFKEIKERLQKENDSSTASRGKQDHDTQR